MKMLVHRTEVSVALPFVLDDLKLHLRAPDDAENAAMQAMKDANAVDFSMTRDQRNVYLANSDWTDLPNAPLTASKKAEWQTYRQELRDYPSTSSDGTVDGLPEWPTPPE